VGSRPTLAEAIELRDTTLAKDGDPPADESPVVFLDRKESEPVDWREFVELASQSQQINERLDDTQRIASVAIETDHPIAVMFSGDWQLGDGATDHQTWAADMEFLLQTDDLYMAELGDKHQNMRAFKTLSGVLSQVLSPPQQAKMLRSLADEMSEKHKVLAWVDGNHDGEFDERIFGEALLKYLLERAEAPRFINRGLLKLTVGGELYTLLLFHKSRFRSFMRTTHGNYREMQLSYPADVVAGAHDHVAGYELIENYSLARDAGMGFGGATYLVKVGTYQDSEFGWRYFHNGGRPLNPTIVFWPGEHRMQIFNDPRSAVEYMRAVREVA